MTARDIRAREIREAGVTSERLSLDVLRYSTSAGEEAFLQFVTQDDRLAGFARLCLPAAPSFIDELASNAILREVHVYGSSIGIGDRSEGKAQHSGLGRRLIEAAREEAKSRGFGGLSVISSVGTREYYRRLGFKDGSLYQHLA